MVDIYVFKIGGTEEKKNIYQLNKVCNHWRPPSQGGDPDNIHCVENEFCKDGFLIPRDQNTIQAAFNFYQVLQILDASIPDHPSLKRFKRDNMMYNLLMKDYDLYIDNVFKESVDQNSSAAIIDGVKSSNLTEQRLLEELIIKSFPQVYINHLEKLTLENPELQKSNLLMMVIQRVKIEKTTIDQSKVLEKLHGKFYSEIEKLHMSKINE